MLAIVHDVIRAVLVLVVLAVGCEILAAHRGRQEPPVMATSVPVAPAWQPAVQPVWQAMPPEPQPGPIRRVARDFVDLAESVIGVIR